MARPKGSKNKAQAVEADPTEIQEGEYAPKLVYCGSEGCVQFRGVEFVRGEPREVTAEVFAALSTRAVFEVV